METLLEIAIRAAKEAGAEILTHYNNGLDHTKKADGSPVTIADERANNILVSHLEKTEIPILSEEMTGLPLPYPKKLWVIDPLDGTKDFIHNGTDFSVMVGLIEDGRPILGVVYAPVLNTLYYAEKGSGAYMVKNDATTQLVITQTSEKLRFIRSVRHFTPEMEYVAEKLNAEQNPRGSIGIKAGLIGENIGDFFFYLGKLGEWDACAPEIITIEAGGTVTDSDGKPLLYGNEDHRLQNGLIFSNTLCHTQVLEAVQLSKAKD
jgi:3'(2'), 5'-bisphosphate nucleotidase